MYIARIFFERKGGVNKRVLREKSKYPWRVFVSREKSAFSQSGLRVNREYRRGIASGRIGGWEGGREAAHVLWFFPVHPADCAEHVIGTVTSELRHEYGRSHVGGLVVVGSLFLCRAPFLDYIGCSTNFYDPAQRFSVKHGFQRRSFREIGRNWISNRFRRYIRLLKLMVRAQTF